MQPTPLRLRLAHNRGEHDGEEETFATAGCNACYRLVALGLSAPAPAPRPAWLDRMGKDLTGFVSPLERN